ncbi:hypothetical protein CRE_18162 [Caenorhabditis remanei]|uniref:Uncharacterized protein n=1 Tax=Caenorhabditis remanei TaxID=31234 RepID=E3N8K3_CAERE|nr:hypothetical protein CRE_18162 [Caenorhabditis remanei]
MLKHSENVVDKKFENTKKTEIRYMDGEERNKATTLAENNCIKF